jgi:hypothetical protein
MATSDDVVTQIIASLRITDPDLDTSVGTTTRKIIDAVGESVGEAYIDSYMLSYTYDIDAKSQGDLDAFCRLFGIARYSAKRATGVATFSRTGPTTSSLTIPYNSIVRSTTDPQEDFILVTPAVFAVGATTATAPIQAVNAGAVGNLGPGTLTIGSNLPVNVSVTNIIGTSGGVEAEGDEELRLRWKRTSFRSLAGTEQMYLGVALDDPDSIQANVISGTKSRFEQLQVVTGAATSTVVDAKYVFPTGVAVGIDLDASNVFIKGTDYTWANSNPPVVTVVNAVAIPNGTLLQASFEYTSQASRNDPTNGIMHRVDVWVSGMRAKSAVQSIVYSSILAFNTTGGSPYNLANYVRTDGSLPTSGNIFIPLNFGPIIAVPEVLTIGGHTYSLVGSGATAEHTDAYRIVHDDTAFGYAPISLFGLEWDSTQQPPANAVFSIGGNDDYTYNDIPGAVQVEIDRWRLLGVDVLAHQAKTINLRMNLALIYTGTIAMATVNAAIDNAISTFLTGLGFDAPVQYSDVLQVVHNVPGVDAVRFMHGDDILGWNPLTPNAFHVGIQQVVNGVVVKSYVDANGRALDVLFSDNEVAGFESVYKSARAQNSFGVG